MQCEALIWVKKNLQHTKLISCSRAKAYFLYSTWVYNFGGVMPKSKPFLLTSQLIILHNMYNGRVGTKKVDRLFKAILTCLFIHTQSPLSSTWSIPWLLDYAGNSIVHTYWRAQQWSKLLLALLWPKIHFANQRTNIFFGPTWLMLFSLKDRTC